jgi:hypothetical protein
MKKISLLLLLSILILISCKNKKSESPINLFSDSKKISEKKFNINDDSLALIEGIQCNDSSLIVIDYNSGKSFTLFSPLNGKYIGRFGRIGQGPGEIPLGCYGNLECNRFTIAYSYTGLIAMYNTNALLKNIDSKPKELTKYKIPEAMLSRIIPLNDSIFLGAGVFKSEFQYLLFNNANKIVDYKVSIFNSKDKKINIYHKHLSNQGTLKKHPSENKFVYSVKYSSNIDFLKIVKNRIHVIKSIHFKNPAFTPIQNGIINQIVPDKNCTIGYLDLATSSKYVYALYTDKHFFNNNDKENNYCSKTVLVFDWNGNPVKKYELKNEAYYITINEHYKTLYAAIKKSDGGWSVVYYEL